MHRVSSMLLAGLLLGAAPLHAQGWIEPGIRFQRDFGVTKVRTSVSVHVRGRVALVEVEEWFQNHGPALGEGQYLYPLPGEAVFTNVSLFQGDRELHGETMNADSARAIYEEIVRRKRDPALIELAGHGLLRARVFPIAPGETRKITLRYTQMLARAGDALQFRYAAGGRAGTVASVDGGTRLGTDPEGAPLTFTVVADSGDAYGQPFSPTTRLTVTRDDGRLTVRPAEALTGDFALFLPLARNLVGLTLVTHRPSSEPGYFMLTLSPGHASGRPLPRDITAVVDVSGSMSGEKLDQAKTALRQLLQSLGHDDRFRLIAFSSGVRSYGDQWTEATPDAVHAAQGWIDALIADGGTNIAGALTEAFRLPGGEARLPVVVFLTDGIASVGEQNPERIAEQVEQVRGDARVFAFGVGYDVNTYLLDRVSAAGRGATQYVQPNESVADQIGTLVAKIQNPVLVDLALGDAPVRITEVYPAPLPDLFAGDELVIFGRYEAAGTKTGSVTVTGRRNGRPERFNVDATFPAHADANDYLERLWAARKLGVLSRQARLSGATPALVAEIRETALRYGLLSEYTSYLVQEPRDVAGVPASQPSVDMMKSQAASGQGAVMAAEAARIHRAVNSAADLRAADSMALGTIGGRPQAVAGRAPVSVRVVAGRGFILENGVWTDRARTASADTVAVEPFGPAYFRLLSALPELKPYLTAFEQVLVAGHTVNIIVRAGGAGTLSDRRIAEVVTAFRGH